jgi:hypothetical protein
LLCASGRRANPRLIAGNYSHSGVPYGGFVSGGDVTFSVSNPHGNFRINVANDPPTIDDLFEVYFDDLAASPDWCAAHGGCGNAWMLLDLRSTANLWESDALPTVLPFLTGEAGFMFAVGEITSLAASSAVPSDGVHRVRKRLWV